MFTKIIKKYAVYGFFWASNFSSTKYYGDEYETVLGNKFYVKAAYSSYCSFASTFGLSNSDTNNDNNIHVGSGTTPPTENDYCLENPITSGLSGTVSATKNQSQDNPDDLNFAVTLTNTSSSDITVSEIGKYAAFYCNAQQNSATSNTSRVFLVDRTLLDVPVTISPGETVTINYKIAISQLS